VEKWLASILSRISGGELLPTAYFSELDCDAALDARDGDSGFEAAWVRLYKQIERRWNEATISESLRSVAEDIRRESFLAVSRATRQHEIASYVSDDFQIIVRGRLVGETDLFLEQLWCVYERGKFPSPPL
jgi:hypothetical protein